MRISPKQLLQSLLYLTPITLLALASCGGGGGGSSTPGLAASYTVGGAASGVQATTINDELELRLNGGDALNVASGVKSYTFPAAVVAGTPYSVTVLKHPSSPVQKCTVLHPAGTMPNYNVTNADVSCVPAYTISGTITGLGATSTGLVLQNNGGDNYLVPAGATSTFAFSTPLISGANFDVTVLSQPHNPNKTCTASAGGTVPAGVNTVVITCGAYVAPAQADPYLYVANLGTSKVSVYAASGVLASTATTTMPSGSGPASIAADPGSKFAYVTNQNSNTITGYNIASGVLTTLTDVDAGTAGNQTSIATGNTPYAIAIHPSGKFAYVVNYLGNSVSVYSIDPTTGALASVDADGGTAGTQASIPTRSNPVSITIDPSGSHAYVANSGSGNVSAYSINSLTGALTAIPAAGAGTPSYIASGGTTPYSVKVSPDDKFLYIANRDTSNNIQVYSIDSAGALTSTATTPSNSGDTSPVSIAIDPKSIYVYVANQGSNNIGVFKANGSGGLTPQGSTTLVTGTAPISITLDSTGQYAYVANYGNDTISTYSISSTTGALTLVGTTTAVAGSRPNSVITTR